MSQFTITIDRAKIRAALIFAAEKDIRHYLNGVCMEIGECGDARLVATDGHRLAVLTVGDHPGAVPGEYLIPRDVLKHVKRASRSSGADVSLQIDDTRVMVASGADIIAGGLLIDGKFPDWQRVCPDPERMSGEPGTYNAQYVADIASALIELGDRCPAFDMLQQGKTGPGLVIDLKRGLMVATMPMLSNGFVPTRSAREHFMPRRPVFCAVVETAAGGQAFPCDPAQNVDDKRAPAPSTATTSGEDEARAAVGTPDRAEKIKTVERLDRDGVTRVYLAGVPKECDGLYPLQYGALGVAEARAAKLRAAGIAATVRGRGPYSVEVDPSGEVVAEACPTLLPGRWIPDGGERVAFDGALGAEVWIVPSRRQADAVEVIAYSGKRTKHDAYYTKRDREQALQWAGEYMSTQQARAQRQAERRAEKAAKRAAGHKLKPGDVLRCSWGYDQTNIDYYEVTRLIGARMVEIREIGAESVESGSMTGECVPRPGHYIGEPMRKAVSDYDGQSVRIASYASAHKIEPREVGGVKVYPVDHWTAYA